MKLIVAFIFLTGFLVTAQDKIKLSDVQALTLKAGQQTTARRTTPSHQLKCFGSFCQYAPDTVQCTNVGTDGIDAQWKCEAELPGTLSIAPDYVLCEGYEYPTDPYILIGSCGLSYHLNGSYRVKARQDYGWVTIAVFVCLLVCGCRCNGERRHGGCGDFATGVGVGAAASHLLRPRRRGYTRSSYGWFGGHSRRSSHRKSTGFCGTLRK